MDNTIDFVVADQRIRCGSCEGRIAYALRQLPGVRDVRASAETQHVLVSVDPAGTIGAEQIGGKLKDLGYEAQRFGGAA